MLSRGLLIVLPRFRVVCLQVRRCTVLCGTKSKRTPERFAGALSSAAYGRGHRLSTKGGLLARFEIAGDDHKFLTPTARIDGDNVVVSNPQITSPKFVH